MQVEWTSQARKDLREVLEYIAERNVWAADNLFERIEQSVSHLPEHPYLYKRSQRVPSAREIVVHPNYIVYYRVDTTSIQILAVVHSHRNYPG